jgi:hypothetical protein
VKDDREVDDVGDVGDVRLPKGLVLRDESVLSVLLSRVPYGERDLEDRRVPNGLVPDALSLSSSRVKDDREVDDVGDVGDVRLPKGLVLRDESVLPAPLSRVPEDERDVGDVRLPKGPLRELDDDRWVPKLDRSLVSSSLLPLTNGLRDDVLDVLSSLSPPRRPNNPPRLESSSLPLLPERLLDEPERQDVLSSHVSRSLLRLPNGWRDPLLLLSSFLSCDERERDRLRSRS